MKVNGKTWVVTGAGSGMGRQAGARPSLHVVDITDRAAVEALPAAC